MADSSRGTCYLDHRPQPITRQPVRRCTDARSRRTLPPADADGRRGDWTLRGASTPQGFRTAVSANRQPSPVSPPCSCHVADRPVCPARCPELMAWWRDPTAGCRWLMPAAADIGQVGRSARPLPNLQENALQGVTLSIGGGATASPYQLICQAISAQATGAGGCWAEGFRGPWCHR